MSLAQDFQDIPRLFGDAVQQLAKLVQNEAQLARTEISQKITQAMMGAGLIAGAAILIIPVLVVLLIALALWLSQFGLALAVAFLIAAATGAIVSIILAVIGMGYLRSEQLIPKVTLEQLGRDASAAKDIAR